MGLASIESSRRVSLQGGCDDSRMRDCILDQIRFMTITYKLEGEPVLAARYTGNPSSVNAIMDMIGSIGVNNTELGLLINRFSPTYVKKGQWVVKLPKWKWWWLVEPKTFEAEYERA